MGDTDEPMTQPGFRLTVLSVAIEPLNAAGDVCLNASVDSQGFTGTVVAWVLGPAMDEFLAELRRLYDTFSGDAHLESMSPGEIDLHIRRGDAAGHVRVDGRIAARSAEIGRQRYDHAVEFGVWWELEGVRIFADDLAMQIAVQHAKQRESLGLR